MRTPRQRLSARTVIIILVATSLVGAALMLGFRFLGGSSKGELTDFVTPMRARVATMDVSGGDPEVRMGAAFKVLNRNQVEIVGFQGLRTSQYYKLKGTARTSWSTFPDPNSKAAPLSTAIAWRTDRWALVSGGFVDVPTRDDEIVSRPYVRLMDLATRHELYVASFDNPADRRPKAKHHDQSEGRAKATRIAAELVTQLRGTGVPVVMTVQPNDTSDSPHRFFCSFTKDTPARNASGGRKGPRKDDKECEPPADAEAEQLYATNNARFSHYQRLRGDNTQIGSDTVPVMADLTYTPKVHPFRIATFNVLGASHTAKGGNKPKMASGNKRMVWTVGLLKTFGIEIVGFQELELSQHAKFTSLTGSAWATYPGTELGNLPTRNSVAWRTDLWEAVSKQSIQIPYFDGELIRMPYVLLQNKQTGALTYVANFHNPASTRKWGNQSRWRAKATKIQIQLAKQIHATGIPLIFTGDFNDRDKYFCPLVQQAPMAAANGGSRGPGPCQPPANAGIDWIFGSHDNMGFEGYTSLRNRLVKKTSDHPFIYTDASANPVPRAPTLARLATLDASGGDPLTRASAARSMLNNNGINLVGFQGLSRDAFDSFHSLVGTEWSTYPDVAEATEFGAGVISTTLAWRADSWSLVSGATSRCPVATERSSSARTSSCATSSRGSRCRS